jgi:CBS domain containing-hemolysin-like protein
LHEDEDDARVDDPQPISEGVWEVPGGFPVDRLDELAGQDWHPEEDEFEAQTVGGLVSETEGRIPHAGEVVEIGSLRIEVIASSDRRVERVRIHLTPNEAAVGVDEEKESMPRLRNGNGFNGIEVE